MAMTQEERSQKSRAQILDAALQLFSHRGYGATSVRDIADRAGVSTGAVYHQFRDKETIFRTLLDVYWRAIEDPDFPVNRALRTGSFPENIEEIGRASREAVSRYRPYVALIYVDVVEFEGSHIRKFYSEMAGRFESFIALHRNEIKVEGKIRPGINPASAVMLVFRTFMQHFAVELVFGVSDHYGKDTDAAVTEIAAILRHGMVNPQAGG
jgi:AcrR family transcriptional regulator